MGADELTIRDAVIGSGLVIAALALSVPGPLWLAGIGFVVGVALTAWRPGLAAALTPLSFPFTFYPRSFEPLSLPFGLAPAEAAVVVLGTGLLARLGWLLTRGARPNAALWHAHRPPDWAWLPALGLGLAATLSLATVADPTYLRESIREYRTVIAVPLAWAGLAWLALTSRRDRWLALLALGGAGAFAGLDAAWRLGLGIAGVAAEDVRRALGPFQHPNHLALFVGRAAAACLGLALAWPGARGRWLALALVLPASLGMFLSFSRGGWFALVLTLAFLGLVLGYRRVVGGAIGLALTLLVLLPLTGLDRLRVFDGESGSGLLRLDIWRSALLMIRDRPWTGVGLDQFLYQYQRRYVAPEAWPERFTAHAHTFILDFWTRLGILGLIAGLVMFGVALWACLRLTTRLRGEDRAIGAAAGGIVAYSLLHGMVDNSYFVLDLALTFWLAVVVLARTARDNDRRGWRQVWKSDVSGAGNRGPFVSRRVRRQRGEA